MISRVRARIIRALGGVVDDSRRSQTVDADIDRAEELCVGFWDIGQDDVPPVETMERWTPPPGAMKDPDRPQSHL